MKNSGHIVLTKSGKRGRTFSSKLPVNGKIIVYMETNEHLVFGDKGVLCEAKSLIIKGYID